MFGIDRARRVAFALLATCAAAAGARGAQTSHAARAEALEDGSAAILDTTGREVCRIRLEIVSGEGEAAKVFRAFGRKGARAVVGGATFRLSARAREAGGGVVIDLRATPAIARGSGGAWEEPSPVRARVVATLPGGATGRGSARIGTSDVLLGPAEALGPDVLAKSAGVKRGPVRASAHARYVEVLPEKGAPLVLQGEVPGKIGVEEDAEGGVLLGLPWTDADTATPLAFAAYVGRRPYAGRPVFLETPSVAFLPDLGCFEVRVRAFGDWSDPFDPEDVAIEAAWEAGSREGRVAGFFSRDIRNDIKETEGGEKLQSVETLSALGWPGFRARVPERATGGTVAVTFATKGGRIEAARPVPSSRLWSHVYADGAGRAQGGVTLDCAEWKTTEAAAKAIQALGDAKVRAARIPLFTGDWAVEGPRPGEADLDAAWRADRVFAEAAKRGVRLVPILAMGGAPEEFAASSPYFKGEGPLAESVIEFLEGRGARAAFRRKLRYAAARWGAVPSLGRWEIFDGLDLACEGAAAEALAPWLESMAEWLKAHDPDHAAAVVLRGDFEAELLRRSGVLVGRAVEIATSQDAPGGAFEVARSASEAADFLVLEAPDGKGRPTHASLWAAATAAAGGGVYLGAGPVDGDAEAVARYLAEGGAPGPLPRALSFEDEGYRLLGRRGPRGAAWLLVGTPPEGPLAASSDDDDAHDGPRLAAVVRDVEFEIEGLVPGRYAVEWWQTHAGEVLTRTEVRAPEGRVLIAAPPFASDLAGRLVRLDDTVPSFLGN